MSFAGFLRQNATFLGVGALLTLLSSFGQTFFISAFAGDIRSEFNLSHSAWGTLYATSTLAAAIAMVWLGGLTDRLQVRHLGVLVLFCLAAAMALTSIAKEPLFLLGAVFLLRLFGQGMASHIATVAMARWFHATRGRAIAVAFMGVSVGEAFLPLAVVFLLGFFDWRAIWLASGAVVLLATPLLSRLLRLERRPQSLGNAWLTRGMMQLHWSRREMLSHWLFWAMLPFLLGPPAFSTAFFFQQVHIAETKGWSHAGMVSLFPFFTGAAVTALLGAGWLVDRFGAHRLIGFILAPMSTGFLVMSCAQEIWLAAIAMVLMGMSQGAFSTVPTAFWAELYGTKHLGSIRAAATAVMVFGTSLGPALSGMLIDRGMTLPQQMVPIAGYFLASSLVVFLSVARVRVLIPHPPKVDI